MESSTDLCKNNKENVYLINVTCMEDNIEFGCFRGTVFFYYYSNPERSKIWKNAQRKN